MRSKKPVVVALLALLAALFTTAQSNDDGQPVISEVTVLLPFTSEHETVSKTITAKNGCFRWFASSLHHNQQSTTQQHNTTIITIIIEKNDGKK